MPSQSDLLALLALISPKRSSFRKRRIGTLGDGGYVLPDDLEGISRLLSIGIGGEVSFDLHFAALGVPIFQYDPTIDNLPAEHPNFSFSRLAWAAEDSISGRSLAGMLSEHNCLDDADGILKFDVEGAEWECFDSVSPEQLKPFRLIVCELHALHRIANQQLYEQTSALLRTLTHSHTAVHLHANNCCGIKLVEGIPIPAVIELSLLRNDRSTFTNCSDPIPGPLDFPNMTDRPDIVLNAFG